MKESYGEAPVVCGFHFSLCFSTLRLTGICEDLLGTFEPEFSLCGWLLWLWYCG